MKNADDVFNELREANLLIVNRFVDLFIEIKKKDPKNFLEQYADTIFIKFQNCIATTGVEALHRYMGEGVDDDAKLVMGVLQVTRDSASIFTEKIQQILF